MNIRFTPQEEAWFRLQGNESELAEAAKLALKKNPQADVAFQISLIFQMSNEERQAKIDAFALERQITEAAAVEAIKNEWKISRKDDPSQPIENLFQFAVQLKPSFPGPAEKLLKLIADNKGIDPQIKESANLERISVLSKQRAISLLTQMVVAHPVTEGQIRVKFELSRLEGATQAVFREIVNYQNTDQRTREQAWLLSASKQEREEQFDRTVDVLLDIMNQSHVDKEDFQIQLAEHLQVQYPALARYILEDLSQNAKKKSLQLEAKRMLRQVRKPDSIEIHAHPYLRAIGLYLRSLEIKNTDPRLAAFNFESVARDQNAGDRLSAEALLEFMMITGDFAHCDYLLSSKETPSHVKLKVEQLKHFQNGLALLDYRPDVALSEFRLAHSVMDSPSYAEYARAVLIEYTKPAEAIVVCQILRNRALNENLRLAAAILEAEIQQSSGNRAEAVSICEQIIQTGNTNSIFYLKAQLILAADNAEETLRIAERVLLEPLSPQDSRNFALLQIARHSEAPESILLTLIEDGNVARRVRNQAKVILAKLTFEANPISAAELCFQICEDQYIDQQSFQEAWNLLMLHAVILDERSSELPSSHWSLLFQAIYFGTKAERLVRMQSLEQNVPAGTDVRAVINYMQLVLSPNFYQRSAILRTLEDPNLPALFKGAFGADQFNGNFETLLRNVRSSVSYTAWINLNPTFTRNFTARQEMSFFTSIYSNPEVYSPYRDLAVMRVALSLVRGQKRAEAIAVLREYLRTFDFEVDPKVKLRIHYAQLIELDNRQNAIEVLTGILSSNRISDKQRTFIEAALHRISTSGGEQGRGQGNSNQKR